MKKDKVENISVAIMQQSMREMRKNGIDVGDYGSEKALEYAKAISKAAKQVILQQAKPLLWG